MGEKEILNKQLRCQIDYNFTRVLPSCDTIFNRCLPAVFVTTAGNVLTHTHR